MCGIIAVLSRRDPIGQDFTAALTGISHRGPDDTGVSLVSLARTDVPSQARAWLGHTRLSIIDLSARGHQPMQSADGRYQLIYNGEIYNFVELRSECKAAGATFESDTDTEVLLHAWRLWGPECVHRLKGMFAFVVIDRAEGTAAIVRDQFGIKPLYYAESADHVVICSEAMPILRTGLCSNRLDARLAYEYLRFGATQSSDRSMFADIRSLPAAHLATFDFRSGKLSTPQCYWQLRQQPRNIAFPDAVAECRERFIENIRLHLRSDVPVGAALSGGIDSSAVVCVMRNLQPDLDLQTFSYISDDPAHSEERWVDLVHAKVGGVCHKIRPDPKDLAEDIELLVARQGEPFASASIYAQFRVFRAARAAGVPVTLDGQGADELLGGYWPHVGTRASQELLSGRVDNTLRLISNAAPGLSGKRLTASLLLQNLLSGKFRRAARRLAGRELFPNYFSQEWFESAGVDWRHLADEMLGRYRSLHEHLISNVTVGSLPNLLRYADRNSMAFAVESRVPFLTVDFAEFLMSLPARYLISPNGVRKYIFREAMKGILPEPIRTRQDKIGFFADDGTWLRRNAAQFADTWAELADEPLFDKNQFRRFVADFHAGRDNRALLAWRALVFGVWLRQSRRAVAASR